jgi:tRNA (guanosine-2'-O-)-methyltransferase
MGETRPRQLTGKGIKHFLRRDERPEVELVFVLQDVEDPVNVGAAFRIADACGARRLILTGLTPVPPDQTIHGVGRGAHRRVHWSQERYASDALEGLKAEGYTCYAIEVATNSAPYHSVEYPERVCLVVGNEHHGVTTRTLAACDGSVYIPMYGKVPSLNVHVALAVVAFHVLHGGHRGEHAG